MSSIPLNELPAVDAADVYKQGTLAATMRRIRSGIEFRYTPDYLASGGTAVATTLPVTDVPVRAPAGAVPPYFAGLLPEGRRMIALRRSIKTSADDDLSILLAIGSDAIGDVQVFPTGVAPDEARAAVVFDDLSTVSFQELFIRSIGAEPDRIGIPGVQDKVSARMITMPVHERGSSHILKLNPPEFPGLVANEHFFLEAARMSGIPSADARIVVDAEGEQGLLVTRFDRVEAGGAERALAMEDGCQVLGRYPADKYTVTAETVCAGLASHARSPKAAALALISQLAFAYLSGNGDAHAKNFAMVTTPQGEWRISRAFDVPSSYLYGDTSMAISIDGRRGADVPRRSFMKLAQAIGSTERVAGLAIDELCDKADLWIPRIVELPFDKGRLKQFERAVQYRRRLLRGAGGRGG